MICVSIMAPDRHEALKKIRKAGALADYIELRLDALPAAGLAEMISIARRPVIATFRSAGQGGSADSDAGYRTMCLIEALRNGASFVDVEYDMPQQLKDEIFRHAGMSRVILSSHFMEGTPTEHELEKRACSMAGERPYALKLVTLATRPEHNLRVLGLLTRRKNFDSKMIAFCMGEPGRISRITCVPMGSWLTFASVERGQESAKGQMTADECRRIRECMRM